MSEEERKERAERARSRKWTNKSKEKLRKKALSKPTIEFALRAANSSEREIEQRVITPVLIKKFGYNTTT